ncbi:DUF1569 domain-containing protein [Undibacterium sp. TJN19]|uniref:DUF1569 domain-containing protein n=1 Tax=Undibacterium sp. TJN19 TaxID=3413055 RepID=UPI003BEFC953
MKKRTFIFTGVAATLLVSAGYAGYRKSTMVRTSVAEIQVRLLALQPEKLVSKTGWPPYKVFVHLAQSIEYSMTGYPEIKSAVFQQTAGSAAFYAFSVAGAMTHSLTEPIPGAPVIAETGKVSDAIAMVITALQKFEKHVGEIKPHFAYGSLSKAEFAQAHVMHIENHLKAIDTQV